MEFQFYYFALLFLLLPFIWRLNSTEESSLHFSDVSLFSKLSSTWRLRLRNPVLLGLRTLAIILFILAIMRPRIPHENVWNESEGVDILLVVDTSSSMLAEDFKIGGSRVNRLEVVKKVVDEFIKDREQDRVGIVMFAGEAMTLCPLTTDYGVLSEYLQKIEVGLLEDGTAIGTALAYGTNRLHQSKAKSKVMVLLTDGANTAGKIDPTLGAELAATKKVKVYTIGAGVTGSAPYPVDHPIFGKRYQNVEFKLDEKLMKKIASVTGGKYYRATDTESLRDIYQEIGELEKTKVKVNRLVNFEEVFQWFLIPALFVLLLELILSQTIFMKVP